MNLEDSEMQKDKNQASFLELENQKLINSNLNSKTSYFMLFLATLFFFYQFVPRVWLGLTMDEITNRLQINSAEYGFLASTYYYGYAFMQIPMAILLNKFGIRLIMSVCMVLCGLMMIIFVVSTNFYIACLVRFLTGVVSAAGIMGISAVIIKWFTTERHTRLIGIALGAGLIGAIYGNKPVSIFLEKYDYISVGYGVGSIGILLSIIMIFCLKSSPISKNSASAVELDATLNVTSDVQINPKGFLSKLSKITNIISWQILLLGIVNMLMIGVLEGFADVWSVEYLMHKFYLAKPDAAFIVSMIFFGVIVGTPILTYLESKLDPYLLVIFSGIIMITLMFSLIYFDPSLDWINSNLSWLILCSIFTLLGVFSGYQGIILGLGFKFGAHAGVIVAFLNTLNMLGGSMFHTLIGYFIEFNSKNSTNLIETYGKSLTVIPIACLIGVIISCFLYMKKNSNKNINQ